MRGERSPPRPSPSHLSLLWRNGGSLLGEEEEEKEEDEDKEDAEEEMEGEDEEEHNYTRGGTRSHNQSRSSCNHCKGSRYCKAMQALHAPSSL